LTPSPNIVAINDDVDVDSIRNDLFVRENTGVTLDHAALNLDRTANCIDHVAIRPTSHRRLFSRCGRDALKFRID
jgi:hypothetical protein